MLKSFKADITTYMWFLLPLSEKFGDKIFDVAAKSLAESGVKVTAEEMKAIARDMKLPEKQDYYKEMRLGFINYMIQPVYRKGVKHIQEVVYKKKT